MLTDIPLTKNPSDGIHPLRPFLKNWLWERGHIGTRYADLKTRQLKFDEGKKASFAAELPSYFSLAKDGTPDMQTAPLVHDTALAKFLKAAQSGTPAEAGSTAEVQRAVQECVDIAVRCAYQHAAAQAQQHYAQEAMFDDEIRQAVFLDIRKRYMPLREQMMLYDFSILYGFPAPLVFCDCPLIDWLMQAKPTQPFVTIALAPHALLVGAASAKTSRAGPVTWTKAGALGPFKDHNSMLAAHAKQWLVATTDEQLEGLLDLKPPVQNQ